MGFSGDTVLYSKIWTVLKAKATNKLAKIKDDKRQKTPASYQKRQASSFIRRTKIKRYRTGIERKHCISRIDLQPLQPRKYYIANSFRALFESIFVLMRFPCCTLWCQNFDSETASFANLGKYYIYVANLQKFRCGIFRIREIRV